MDKKRGYLWLVGACLGFFCTGLLAIVLSANIKISPIQNAYYVLMPALIAIVGSLAYARVFGTALSLAGLVIVVSLVVIEGIRVLPFVIPITFPLIAGAWELWAVYEMSQYMNRRKVLTIISAACCISVVLGMFSSYSLGLKFPIQR